MQVYHEIIKFKNVNDKEDILNTLSRIYTDEDFSGNNGEDFTSEAALESGFSSDQDYVIDKLRKSDLTGEDLIVQFFEEWLRGSGYDYYDDYSIKVKMIGKKKCVASVCASHEI